jgi:hypothetical protein
MAVIHWIKINMIKIHMYLNPYECNHMATIHLATIYMSAIHMLTNHISTIYVHVCNYLQLSTIPHAPNPHNDISRTVTIVQRIKLPETEEDLKTIVEKVTKN